MSDAFVIIKMCYVHNQWYDISCATLYLELGILKIVTSSSIKWGDISVGIKSYEEARRFFLIKTEPI